MFPEDRKPRRLTLVSHLLCPYVQRAAIALAEKGVAFDRVDIDLANKPGWFTAISPLGKVPLLQVSVPEGRIAIFESAAILEYLEETQPAPLHPADPLERARHRGWIEFASAQLANIARLYNASATDAFEAEHSALRLSFERLEQELGDRPHGPLVVNERMSLVDAVYAPVFRYFDVFETRAGLATLAGLPRIAAWRSALAARPSVRDAVSPDYPERLADFLAARTSVLGRKVAAGM